MTILTMFKSTYEILLHNPHVDELLFFPFLEMGSWRTIKTLLGFRGRYDVSINFYPSNRHQYSLFAFIIGAEKRLGHHYLRCDRRGLNFLKNYTIREDPEKHAVEENLALLGLLGLDWQKGRDFPLLYVEKEEEKEHARSYLRERGILGKALFGFHPGSSVFKKHIHKRWPATRFAQLADHLLEESSERRILLFGGKEDMDSVKEILERTKNPQRVFQIETSSIRETASVLRNCQVFVSNDSGLMHLAAALQVPTVALFGPTNPKWVGPWHVPRRIARLGLPCSPCFFYSPKAMDCPADLDYKCMKDLPLEEVIKATEGLLEEAKN